MSNGAAFEIQKLGRQFHLSQCQMLAAISLAGKGGNAFPPMKPAEPRKSEREQFLSRLDALASKVGGKAALANLAGLAPTSLQNYFSGTEPPRPVLIMLARAGGVSTAWLAGEEVEENGLPVGFCRLPFYDLAPKKNLVYPLFAESQDYRIFKKADLDRLKVSEGRRAFLVRMEPGFGMRASGADDLLVDRLARDPSSPPADWTWPLGERALYLIGHRSRAFVRKLRKTKGAVEAIDDRGRVEFRIQSDLAEDFLFWGPVIWRGGPLPHE